MNVLIFIAYMNYVLHIKIYITSYIFYHLFCPFFLLLTQDLARSHVFNKSFYTNIFEKVYDMN